MVLVVIFFFKSGQKLGCVFYMGTHYIRVNIVGLPLPFHNIKCGGNHTFLKVIGLFESFLVPLHFFSSHLPSKENIFVFCTCFARALHHLQVHVYS